MQKIAKKIIAGSRKKYFDKLSADEQKELRRIIIELRSERTYNSKDVKSLANELLEKGEGSLLAKDLPKEVFEAVTLTAKAITEMKGIVNKDGNGNVEVGKSKFVSERLRLGYIGADVTCDRGIFIQTERGKPYGTAVALPTEYEQDGKKVPGVVIGYSIIDARDAKYATPIVGLYLAYKYALEGKEAGKHGFECPMVFKNGAKKSMDANTKAQLTHFEKRALAYFHPDVYSYSRGEADKKVVYENYDLIHSRQLAILGPEKMAKNATKKPAAKKTTKKSTKKAVKEA